ncbi:HSPC176 protein [Thecamonas trahens ATCC 50062]|uniref:HSPC176 protein n=1 Tax=Thecamonas trahens ATCC 50062 TaxID=461836 RepID=A0A0L0D6E7_THETB|nr:HSPC176 protein [Thecamonas trahens ATCC 50062]KNC46888.1 HSPC176 protein [Thecamonas trahens ATCC 50062]|eukprot:XP_013760161.1 HSPC176 protein [Thecamonas trahens ATCC 50062]
MGFHALMHTCLDMVEEAEGSSDSYLGLLTATEDYRVYGYVTNTRITLLAAIADGGELKASNVGSLLRYLHTLYMDAVCNPFHTLDAPLASPRFAAALDQVAATWTGGLIR